MQIPEVVLRCLAAKEPSYPFKRLYRNLYNLDFYLLASSKLAQGDAPARMDGAVIDGVRPLNIDNTIAALKSLSYQHRPVKWIAVPTAEGRKWLHPVPANEDALVLEVLRMLLEAIYEPHFLPSSHGFRPHRSCHTALLQINSQWQARHRANLIPLKAHEIVRNYHAHLSGLYRYYQLAHNVSVLNKFHYIMKYSCFKTLASKTKTSIRKVIRKHAVGGTFAVVYPTAAGWATQPLYNEGYKRMKFGTDDPGVDMLPDA
ncbi:hypothetical protein C1X05_10435 [Laceyella sacchari]|uniref:Type II intron maturase n=1 Tax=Laceyella tengchongensis TaxID=574699 RepID=A0AA45WKS1_9BACL|nr:group II intron reverse transcriptase/maturase [Laceyella tengchongensis]AUS09199.1 hypothetical protein C1X05_10435 [Laceyella sacchari]SMP08586.1 Type II intron maturase [Laceyella tengchongensis]